MPERSRTEKITHEIESGGFTIDELQYIIIVCDKEIETKERQ